MVDRIGRYEIIKELGRGGMAVVYLARDPQFKRQVAIKVLPQQLTFDPQFRARFEREAEVIASLEHAAIVPVHDYGEENGQPYLVMRNMPGGSLRERIKKSRLTLAETQHILERIAPALDKAHRRGVIHRDLKPENILFDDEDEPAISDFGIAKLAESSTGLTGSGIIGTPAYMSPEQVSGKGKLDGRSDQYALAVMVFEMLTGKTLYKADTPMSLAVAHLHDAPPSILKVRKDLPVELGGVFDKVFSKNPKERYADVKAFVAAFGAASMVPPAAAAQKLKAAPPTRILPEKLEFPGAVTTGKSTPNWRRIGVLSVLGLCAGVSLIGFYFASGFVRNVFFPTIRQEINADNLGSLGVIARIPGGGNWSPDGSLFAGVTAGELVLHDSTDFSVIKSAPISSGTGYAFFSPDGKKLTARAEDELIFYSVPDLDISNTIQTGAPISYFKLSPDGTLIATGSDANDQVKLWSVSNGGLVQSINVTGEEGTGYAFFQFSPNGMTLATGNYGKKEIEIWEVQTGRLIRTLVCNDCAEFEGYDGISFNSLGSVLFADRSSEGKIDLWAPSSGVLIRTLDLGGYLGSMELSGDGSFFTVSSNSTSNVFTTYILDSSSGEILDTLSTGGIYDESDGSWTYGVAVSPDSALVVTISEEPALYFWDVQSGELKGTFNLNLNSGPNFGGMHFSPDGTQLAYYEFNADYEYTLVILGITDNPESVLGEPGASIATSIPQPTIPSISEAVGSFRTVLWR